MKESRYNSSSRIKELVTVWASQASMKQRSGRAGRTSSGCCWRLCSEVFATSELLHHTVPEIVRTPLDELILQIGLLFEHVEMSMIIKMHQMLVVRVDVHLLKALNQTSSCQ